jgi:putative intracellular protease/amidase
MSKETRNAIKPVLCVVTSFPIKGDTGQPTGFWLSELTHPLAVLQDAGIKTEIASIRGGQPPVDGFDLSDPVNARFWHDPAFRSALVHSLILGDVVSSRYSAVFFAGGHGTMWDYSDSSAVQRVIREIYEANGVVAAVCHGPASLVNAKLRDGSYLVAGKRVASFTDEEEAEVQATHIVPFLLASTLKARGAHHQPAPNWAVNVVVDGRLVTGQNPASAHGVGETIRDFLISSAPQK